MKLRAGDHVVVITGKDKGKTGKVMRVLEQTGRIVVSDVNMRTKHLKKQANRQGQIIHYEASLSVSNVMLVDSKTKKRSRVGYIVDETGNKKRISKHSGEVVTVSKAKDTKADKKDTKETKETKGTKETKESKVKKSTKKDDRVDATDKKPFWKGLGFGAEAMKDADLKEESHMKEDHRVPDQGKPQDTFTHQRGS
ncbi:50S ribosomal protein L24 [Patescibacteria group bacterium]|nr:50S ribosomal protein L24 [Patescibacteria group bacterium]